MKCDFCGDTEAENPKKVFVNSFIKTGKTICNECVKEIRKHLQSPSKKTGTVGN